ncbi:CD209 antigen-like protein E isoform X3 [Toxotes jaculatrix]|uniref:CD209 antigen-like protein E isoform X3 n=1 Tax=Toxotes jaculatrix TaxID=941984 RepID=UPI001B3ABC41|nr:CD209 antigen-like protein E isoform X3 [Toxotes jaculatrix]XP_040909016.1 CD209 antigen-like protein E isoform X3 [Toxotes jaculatrix]XP_040909017.1 CD209 antigen-like protein E isoform X3 [Toxotes jaculatrix]
MLSNLNLVLFQMMITEKKMPEADVLYSDVQFTRGKGKASVTSSPPGETTYSEIKVVKTAELPGSQQPAVSNGRSKITTERVAVLVLSALLAAAVIALGFTFNENTQTKETLRKLKDEHAKMKNLTGRSCETNTVQLKCPKDPEVKINQTHIKCDRGWEQHGGKCYLFSISSANWEQSRRWCQREGGDLVKIDSTEEQIFLVNRVGEEINNTEEKFWIGLTDSKEEGKWFWVDGSPLDTSLTFWASWEPDNWKEENPDGEDCVRMGSGKEEDDYLKTWWDKSCKASQRIICEKHEENGQ